MVEGLKRHLFSLPDIISGFIVADERLRSDGREQRFGRSVKPNLKDDCSFRKQWFNFCLACKQPWPASQGYVTLHPYLRLKTQRF